MKAEITWESLGLELVGNHYNITPLIFGQKRPVLKQWTQNRADPEKVRQWSSAHNTSGKGPGWGLVLNDQLAAIDIDINIEEVVRELVAALGADESQKPLMREGKPPRLALVYRVDIPLKKQFSDQYTDPDGSLLRVEILGNGQQLVAYNQHPDTGKPYRWLGRRDPRNTSLEDLPLLTQKEVDSYLSRANKILARASKKYGWAKVTKQTQSSDKNRGQTQPSQNKATPSRPSGQCTSEELGNVLEHPAITPLAQAEHDTWVRVGMALHYDAEDQEAAYKLWDSWSEKFGGDAYDGPDDTRKKWDSFGEGNKTNPVTLASLYKRIKDHEIASAPLQLTDFYAYAPTHRFLHVPTRELWPASSVDSRLSGPADAEGKQTRASAWLDHYRSVEQITWAPGMGEIINDKLVDDGGWIDQSGATVFNLYRPPAVELGDLKEAGPWIDHVHTVYPEDADHILDWLAFKAQFPGIKINHGLVLGGEPGVGKDTLLEPVKHTVGHSNFKECAPSDLMRRFNSFRRAVILRISEARDLGDIDRYAFYDHTKTLMAAPPDTLEVDEKNVREYYIPNLVGVIITTNYKGTGLYLPADDRRHYVAWSPLPENPFTEGYWDTLWSWYENGGIGHVAAYLAQRDVSHFNPKARPPRTSAFWQMVDASRAPEDAELADLLDHLQNPDVVTLGMIKAYAEGTEIGLWLDERRNRRLIPHRMEQSGYEPFRNQAAQDGLWKIGGKRQTVYVRKASNLTVSEVSRRIAEMGSGQARSTEGEI